MIICFVDMKKDKYSLNRITLIFKTFPTIAPEGNYVTYISARHDVSRIKNNNDRIIKNANEGISLAISS